MNEACRKLCLALPRLQSSCDVSTVQRILRGTPFQECAAALATERIADTELAVLLVEGVGNIDGCVADEIVSSVCEASARGAEHVEWSCADGGKIPEAIDKLLEKAYRCSIDVLEIGDGIVASVRDRVVKLFEERIWLKRVTTWTCCPNHNADFSLRIPSSNTAVRWLIVDPFGGNRETADVVMGAILEATFSDWVEGGSSELVVETSCGSEAMVVYPSLCQPWEVCFPGRSGSRRWILHRILSEVEGEQDEDQRLQDLRSLHRALVSSDASESQLNELIHQLDEHGRIELTVNTPVESVKHAACLPFVDPLSFTVQGAELTDLHEMLWKGVWMPLAPLNEWALSRKLEMIFISGQWVNVQFGAAMVDSEIVWLRRLGDPEPLRIVCSGIPMSLDRRVIADASCPQRLLDLNCVINTDSLQALAVHRTWLGSRTEPDVLSFFGIGKHASISTHPALLRGQLGELSLTTQDEPRQKVAYPKSQSYKFKFPVVQ